jgi:hypothetical protein
MVSTHFNTKLYIIYIQCNQCMSLYAVACIITQHLSLVQVTAAYTVNVFTAHTAIVNVLYCYAGKLTSVSFCACTVTTCTIIKHTGLTPVMLSLLWQCS